jgi:hypothetical protein
MASKPDLIPSNTLPRGSLPARPRTTPPKALQPSMAPSVLVDEIQHKTPSRARTHTWPLPKAGHALLDASIGLSPTSPQSLTPPPKLNLQEMLDQLDRDMAGCPYYEIHSYNGSP